MKHRTVKTFIKSLASVIKSSHKQHRLLNDAYELLNGALTHNELQKLGHTKEFLSLFPAQAKTIVKQIQNSRTDHIWHFHKILHTNYFLSSLRTMLDNGIPLSEFAKLTPDEQKEFIARKEFILALTKSGISFTKLCEVGSEGLTEMQLNMLIKHPFIFYSLCERDGSPKKIACISMVDNELDKLIAAKRVSSHPICKFI